MNKFNPNVKLVRPEAMQTKADAHFNGLPHLLVVDDEPQILLAIEDLLADSYTVHTALNAEEALGMIEQLPELAVIVSDQRMPGMAGDEFLAEARKHSDAAAIIVTGYSDIDAVINGINRGRVFGYVTKPWKPQELRLMIRAAQGFADMQRELLRERRLLTELMENSPDSIFFKDNKSRFIRINRALATQFGVDHPDWMIGKELTDIGKAFEDPQDAMQEQVILDGGAAVMDRVSSQVGADGELHWISTSKAPVRDDRGRVTGLVGISRDVTERVRATEALKLRHRAVESSANPICIVDYQHADKGIVYLNPAFERVTGYSRAQALGRNPRFLYGQERDQPGLDEIRAALNEVRDGHAVVRNWRPDGSSYWSDVYVSPVLDDGGVCTHFIGFAYDVTDNRNYQQELERQANFDTLTGLPNRNLLNDRIAQSIVHSQRNSHTMALLLIGLDRFKHINEMHGHTVGDRLLQAAATRLLATANTGDTVARVAADEFALVLQIQRTKAKDVGDIAQKICDALSTTFVVDENEINLTASIGICLGIEDGIDAQRLLQSANIAMGQAKSDGGSQYRFFQSSMNEFLQVRRGLESALRHACERRELLLHYQPQVDLKSGQVVGMEALIRWDRPEIGMISPAYFIPLAEETGLIVPIGGWVIKEACRQIRGWKDEGLRVPRMAINLSARQFTDGTIADFIRDTLHEFSLDGTQIEIEITESTAMQAVETAISTLQSLKAINIQLALDDFGTGFSSLAYLKRFPIDFLKVDQSFVRDMTTDPDSAAICLSTINLAHSLRFKAIAEGVETEGQMEYLRRMGCDEMQGYFFSRPLSASDMRAMLASNRKQSFKTQDTEAPPRTLLIVDDEPNVLSALQRLLRSEDYRVLCAGSAREGLEILASNRVQVVLSDQLMPEMNGTEFLARVKQMHPETVRMVLSGYTALDSITGAVNDGAIYKILTKPWDNQVLCCTIDEAFREYERLTN